MYQIIFICLIALFPQNIISKLLLKGEVVDENNKSIRFANVRLQNTKFHTTTNFYGQFTLSVDDNITSKYITASKDDFAIGGEALNAKKTNYHIQLNRLPKNDNKEYIFTPTLKNHIDNYPLKKDKVCQNCHTKTVEEWREDRHGLSAQNINFLELLDKGFKKDFPNSNESCSKCHTPLRTLINSDLQVKDEGINCDFCHKIKDVKVKPNFHGIENIEFLRPKKGELLFGPMNDVFPRFDAYLKVYEQSRYCASCHNGSFWDKKIYSEYEEWKNSDYAKKSISCQSCHMPNSSANDYIADKNKEGYLRDKNEIHSHKMLGIKDAKFMKESVKVSTISTIKDDILTLKIAIKNIGAGHYIPTGSPFRYLELSLKIYDENNNTLKQLTNNILPSWSKNQGDGKAFAKVFRPPINYAKQKNTFIQNYPEYFWRHIQNDFDNRIAPKEEREVIFKYKIKRGFKATTYITLTYYNFFESIINTFSLKRYSLPLYRHKVIIKE